MYMSTMPKQDLMVLVKAGGIREKAAKRIILSGAVYVAKKIDKAGTLRFLRQIYILKIIIFPL